MIFYLDTNKVWKSLLLEVMTRGNISSPRGKTTKEVLGLQTRIDMTHPVVTVRHRKLGYKFLFAEALWIINGDNRLSTINPYSKHIANFSDDGKYFNGAYGPKVVDQLPYVINQLFTKVDTRQAVMNIWRERPGSSKDIPCTLSAQWLIREETLHCLLNMRSSDAWLGWPYDIFNFSMLSCFILLHLRQQWLRHPDPQSLETSNPFNVGLGSLTLTAGSQHLYEENYYKAQDCYRAGSPNTSGGSWTYPSLNPSQYNSPEDFLDHLKALRDRDFSGKCQFMSTLEEELNG